MPRRPTDTVIQVNLRITTSEHRRLERAAKAHETSLNAEMAHRLAQSFEQDQLIDVLQVHESLGHLRPLLDNIHELNKQGDLLRTIDALIHRIQPLLAAHLIDGVEAEAIKQDIGKIQLVMKMIEIEAGQRLRRMHTAGEAS
jgi:hypothetical protein